MRLRNVKRKGEFSFILCIVSKHSDMDHTVQPAVLPEFDNLLDSLSNATLKFTYDSRYYTCTSS